MPVYPNDKNAQTSLGKEIISGPRRAPVRAKGFPWRFSNLRGHRNDRGNDRGGRGRADGRGPHLMSVARGWWAWSGCRGGAGLEGRSMPLPQTKKGPKSQGWRGDIFLNFTWRRTEGQQQLRCPITKQSKMSQLWELNIAGMETIEKVLKYSLRKKGAFTASPECS